MRRLRVVASRARQAPLTALAFGFALVAGVYVIVYPFTLARYPPMTDLPMHAACASIFRHYRDPSFHFIEQFRIELLKVPYWTHTGFGALLAYIFPIGLAMKLSTIALLAMLPAGLAVLFQGMKKSPLLGVFGLGFVWNTLSHWGFINFVGALGLFCMALGLTFLLLDRPTRFRQIALALVLVLVFGSHVFRYPFTVAAVLGSAVVLYPATRRWKEVLLPIVPSLTLALLWYIGRDTDGTGPEDVKLKKLDFSRIDEIPRYVFGGLRGTEEWALAKTSLWVLGVIALLGLLSFFFERRYKGWAPRDWAFHAGTHVVVACAAALFFTMYLTLPMEIGLWWYVYPREIVSASLVAVALCPDLPRAGAARLMAIAAIGVSTMRQAWPVALAYAHFDTATRDFQQIVERIPKAPRLGYVVFDHTGSLQETTPFIHLPAWVQAEKGGWLSFHFVAWNTSPIRYRTDSTEVPPPTPIRFEWLPHLFDFRTRGRFFDTFLVRSRSSPERLLAVDPSIRLIEQRGTWWLFRREVRQATMPSSTGGSAAE
jgi:hypothetical protein